MPLRRTLGGWTRQLVQSYFTPAGRQAAGNLAVLVVCQLVTQLCGLGTLLVLTRGLGEIQYGGYVFCSAVVPYLFCLGSLGGGAIALRQCRLYPQQIDETTTSFLLSAGIISLLLAVIVGCVSPWLDLTASERILLLLVAAGNVAWCLSPAPLYDAQHRQALAALLVTSADVIGLGVLALLRSSGRLGLLSAGLVLVGKWLAVTSFQWHIYLRKIRSFRWSFSGSAVGHLLRSSLAPVLTLLLFNVCLYAGVFYVRYRLGEAATAVYGVAVQFSSVLLDRGLLGSADRGSAHPG